MKKKGTCALVRYIDPQNPDMDFIREAARLLRSGGLAAFPTETVYGLGAAYSQPQAVLDIYKVKGRPEDNPLILHIADSEDFFAMTEKIPPYAEILVKMFWPGPLTLVAKKSARVPEIGTAGLPTVAMRMPAHDAALALIKEAGPVFAPSANISGRPSPTAAEHVINDLGCKIDLILDGGPCLFGLESTVLDVTGAAPRVLRPGGITAEKICEAVGNCEADFKTGRDEKPMSPGMKYKHYAPEAELYVIAGEPVTAAAEIIRRAAGFKNAGALATSQTINMYPDGMNVINLGDRNRPEEISARLYSALREMDARARVIYAEGILSEGIGEAIMNRLSKAAGGKVLYL